MNIVIRVTTHFIYIQAGNKEIHQATCHLKLDIISHHFPRHYTHTHVCIHKNFYKKKALLLAFKSSQFFFFSF